jgi:hypothetical protein
MGDPADRSRRRNVTKSSAETTAIIRIQEEHGERRVPSEDAAITRLATDSQL